MSVVARDGSLATLTRTKLMAAIRFIRPAHTSTSLNMSYSAFVWLRKVLDDI